jgi:SPX domain protein involved in polyphosphate accumulation
MIKSITEGNVNFRCEEKYISPANKYAEVIQSIKNHSANFKEVYYTRQINNIYLDSAQLKNFYEHVNGSTERVKIRIRWYGDEYGGIANPQLEFKYKNNKYGTKVRCSIDDFHLPSKFNTRKILDLIKTADDPQLHMSQLISLRPTVFNLYTRSYFQSFDENFIITVDRDLSYSRIQSNFVNLNNRFDDRRIIIELKYDKDLQKDSFLIKSELPWSLSRNSKYVSGITQDLFQ